MNYLFRIVIVALMAVSCTLPTSAKEQAPGTPLVCDTVMCAPNLTADQIYNNVKVWFANNMRSANNVIQLDDTENKHIIGKANMEFNVNNLTWSSLTGRIWFTIDIAAREGRYRVKLSDFNHEAFRDGWTEGIVYINGPNPNVKGLRKKQNSEMQKRAGKLCIDNIAFILASLQDAMSGNASVNDGDW